MGLLLRQALFLHLSLLLPQTVIVQLIVVHDHRVLLRLRCDRACVSGSVLALASVCLQLSFLP